MCGISGVVNLNGISNAEIEKVRGLTRALEHRGPDNEGFYGDINHFFGHRRLSILDLSQEANQPLVSENGITIVFNGEIYNFSELRQMLESKYNFKTRNSDTEVIAFAYLEWGIKFINKLNGMFAIALFDSNKNKLFLIRDRIGQKPLYYHKSKTNSVYFTSEIHGFFKSKIAPKIIRKEAIYNYLTFLTTPAPGTFFEDILKVEAGSYLEIDKNGQKISKYWNIAEYLNQTKTDTFEAAQGHTEKLLSASMRYRNISDVPISLALSGGLDSSLNLYYSKDLSKPSTINISYAEKSQFDEGDVAKKYATECKVDFTNKVIDKEQFSALIKEYLPKHKDMPMGDINGVFIYLMSQWCNEKNTKVLLVGEGGDEIGGYPSYLDCLNEKKIFQRVKWLKPIYGISPFKYAKKLDIFYNNSIVSKRHIQGFKEIEKKKFWKPSKDYNSYKVLHDYMNEINVKNDEGYLRKILNIEYKLRLPEQILTRLDYPSMNAGIEVRSPFMDHNLIEYSAQLNFSIKMKNGAKSILKAIAKNKLPKYVLENKKIGFGMLMNPFLKETMPEWYRASILDVNSPIKEFIQESFLERILKQHIKSKDQGFKLWILFALNEWLILNIE